MNKLDEYRARFFNAVQQLAGRRPTEEHGLEFFNNIFNFYANGGTNMLENISEAQLELLKVWLNHAFLRAIDEMNTKGLLSVIISALVYIRIELVPSLLELPLSHAAAENIRLFWHEYMLPIELNGRRTVMRDIQKCEQNADEANAHGSCNHPWWTIFEDDHSVYEEIAEEYKLSD